MATVTQMTDRLTQLASQLPMIAKLSVMETKEPYLNLNAEQWAKGITKLGERISLDGDPFYSPFTVRYKKEHGSGLGAVTDRVTMYMTGSMYGSADLELKENNLNVTFGVPYAADLIERTTDKVFGLTNDNMGTYRGVFMNTFKPKVIEITKLDFV